MAHRLIPLIWLLVLLGGASAAELTDPTRPPDIIAAPDMAESSAVVAIVPDKLQSILISKTRRAAIIDGKTVEFGQMYGNAKLVEINEDNVALLGPQGRRVLKLFPDVTMTQKIHHVAPLLPPKRGQLPIKRKEDK
jgi:MSHA biogenesis protein MshK